VFSNLKAHTVSARGRIRGPKNRSEAEEKKIIQKIVIKYIRRASKYTVYSPSHTFLLHTALINYCKLKFINLTLLSDVTLNTEMKSVASTSRCRHSQLDITKCFIFYIYKKYKVSIKECTVLWTVDYVLSRAKNSGRQCHFKIWLDCHKLKKCPCLIMPMSTKCQKNEKK
jgi:hypothetical protein